MYEFEPTRLTLIHAHSILGCSIEMMNFSFDVRDPVLMSDKTKGGHGEEGYIQGGINS